MKIEIIGGGCVKCKRLKKMVEEVVEENGIKAEIVDIKDITEIMERGIMSTPAMTVDGEMKFTGKVPKKDEIIQILNGNF